MKLAQNLLLALLPLAATTTASARPDCRRLDGPRWEQRLSYAGCLRDARPLISISDPEQVRGLVAQLAASARPSIDIYRDEINRGPWEARLLAAYQLGMTYADLVTRARTATAPELTDDLEPLLVSYTLGAIDAFMLAQNISTEVPEGTPVDAVVRNALANTYKMLETLGLGS